MPSLISQLWGKSLNGVFKVPFNAELTVGKSFFKNSNESLAGSIFSSHSLKLAASLFALTSSISVHPPYFPFNSINFLMGILLRLKM